MRPTPPPPNALRAGILVIAAALLGLSLFTLSVVAREALGITGEPTAGASGSGEGEEPAGGRRIVLRATDDEGLADGRLEDALPAGSVREQWEEWAEGDLAPHELPAIVESVVDPQMSRFHASYDREAELPFAPTGRRGRLTSARGLDLPPNASCDVRVLPVGDSTYNCLIRVTCGGRIVYPNQSQTAGYVSCELDGTAPRRAVDSMSSATDGDPAVAMDLDRGIVTVSEANEGQPPFDVRIELDATPVRVM